MADDRTLRAAQRLRSREAAPATPAAKESAQTAAAAAKGDGQATAANTTVPAVPEETSGQIIPTTADYFDQAAKKKKTNRTANVSARCQNG